MPLSKERQAAHMRELRALKAGVLPNSTDVSLRARTDQPEAKLRRLQEWYSNAPQTPITLAQLVAAMAEHSKLAGHYPAEKHSVAAKVVIEVVMVDKTVHTNILTQGAPVIEGEARMIPEPPQPPV